MPLILDSSVWISGFLETQRACQERIEQVQAGEIKIVLTSYIAAEVVRGLHRSAGRYNFDPLEREEFAWSVFHSPNVTRDFKEPYSLRLPYEMRSRIEYHLIAQLLGIEVKDAPIVTAAFKYQASILTKDAKLFEKRGKIEELLNVKVELL